MLLIQNTNSIEASNCRTHAIMEQIPHRNMKIEDVPALVPTLPKIELAVGSVEFLQEVFGALGAVEPPNITYPESLRKYLGREVQVKTKYLLQRAMIQGLRSLFVKPVDTKRFTGFCITQGMVQEHSVEDFNAFQTLDNQEQVWVSNLLPQILGEWRYYIKEGKIIGVGRYDPDGPDEAQPPRLSLITSMIKDFKESPICYTLDVGLLETGEYVLIEVNDAWAIGLYEKCMKPAVYFEFLQKRFEQILAK